MTPQTGFTVADELFIVPDGPDFLLFAPFTTGVARVNAAVVRRLEQVRGGAAALAGMDPAFVNELAEAGILVDRAAGDRRLSFPEKTGYDPQGLTLFLTTKCTLACTYCYASAGDRPQNMSWETAKTAIDWIFRHAQARQRQEVPLMFHGGGEVTIVWKLLQQCVEYARAEAAARGMRVTVTSGLNGVMTGPLLEWIIGNIDGATVSLDGLPEIHDQQRPLVNGKGSFAIIAAALRRMDEAKFNYGLRVTVTRLGLSRLVESVEYMCRHFKTPLIQLEPVFPSGRAQTNDLTSPDPHEFIRLFRQARVVAEHYGRELKYSGARFGTVSNRFCQVSDDLLAVTPSGFVSSCYEVGEPDDPRADTFFYGRLNAATRELDLDTRKIIRLRTLTVEHKSSCDDCFCKYSCGGECSAKLALGGNAWDATYSPRCIINRELTLDQMRDYLERGGGLPLPPAAAVTEA
jgi:uncharacterized protein